MTSKIYFIFLFFVSAIATWGQAFHVETPGTLQHIVETERRFPTRVRVTGMLNDKDIYFLALWTCQKYLTSDGLREVLPYPTCLDFIDIEDAHLVNAELPDYAFGSNSVDGYKLPRTLKTIGHKAFCYNRGLKGLIIPNSVTEIRGILVDDAPQLEYVRLSNNLEMLRAPLLVDCPRLRQVHLPSRLREIHGGLFSDLSDISPSVAILPETVEVLDGPIYSGVRTIEEAIVPKNVRILREVYRNVPGLRKVKILSDKLEEIGDYTFYSCVSLEKINIPNGIKRIGKGAFFNNSNLKDIVFPSSLEYIGEHAFDGVPLDSIVIPRNVTSISGGAFKNNKQLKKVYSRPSIPPATDEWIGISSDLPFDSSVTETAILYIPIGTLSAYRTSPIFGKFKHIVELYGNEWPTAIGAHKAQPDLNKVYANHGKLHIEISGRYHHAVFVEVYDVNGKQVWTDQIKDKAEISLPKGFYVVKLGERSYKITL